MLSNRWLKDHVRIADNYQVLYAKFHVHFKNIQRKIATKFLSTLVLLLAMENFICSKLNQKYLNMLQSYSIVCSLAKRDTKNSLVMQIRVIAKRAHQGNPKSVFKYSLGQQNNIATTLSRVLLQRYIATLSMYEHDITYT